ncbi:Predicted arabinose efflux permease, MFS family [Nocardia amikacinitolerans]|uniref:Predicted arabinose efflux permease, MFS family n=1 Tax=Nocardia amikacinitolerans TaxID=756689 RepID=A0A285LSA7_9NOCA|nr:MFS transporter [Nocardia amikacinitolerans]MCP2279961.1 putative arabinose efflux permease, MFS family [Nocardia amikacinitolerans]MCP2295771.1 putative arabinose efflux permease, MFS family [Nocardia amikacinitolerans]SNY87789.1 Predicted arabinose efflux permease, MFS family [Nocardia amikacinitolerans]
MKLLADTTPLRNPDFRRLWTTNIVTVVGAQLSVVAVPQQIFQITGSSGYVGLAGLFGLIPLIVFGLWGGALADVMDRRKLMVITTAGTGLTAVLFWAQAAAGLDNVWVVLILFALQQAFFAVNQPTRGAAIARILPPEQLAAASSLSMTVQQVGAIAGPVLAGALIPLIGLSTLYLVDAIALLVTLWAVWRLPAFPPTGDARRAGFRTVLDGFAYLATQRILLASFLVDVIAMVFGMPRALFPQIAHETFGDPASGGVALGLLFAAMSAGAVLGGVFSGWIPRIRRQGLAVVVCIALWGIAMVGFGLAVGLAGHLFGLGVWLWIAVAFLAFGGAVDMVSAALRTTMLLTVATDEMRGRLQGVFIVVVAGGPRIGDVAHGFAAASLGTAVAAAGGGVLVVIGVLLAALAFPAFVRYRVARAHTESLPA